MPTLGNAHDRASGGSDANSAARSRKRKMDDFEWETSKENVMPLKRGRNVPDLNKALRAHDSFQAKVRLDDEVKAKEEAIRAYEGDDPLAGWVEYIRWLEVKMPEDTRRKFTALEKCTRALKDNPRYRNDLRYIRLWIQYVRAAFSRKPLVGMQGWYTMDCNSGMSDSGCMLQADLVSNPKDIFKYLYQNKIGEHVSLFYIGWAYVLETVANYPQAHKIYVKATQKYVHADAYCGATRCITWVVVLLNGLCRKAEPQDLLGRKFTEFQRRMSRQWLRVSEESGANDGDGVGQRHALEHLSSHGPGSLDLGDSQRQQLRQQQAFARAERVQRANAHKPVFIIYEDPAGHTVDPFDGNSGWKKLDTAHQQNKENELAPTAWNQPPARQGSEATPLLPPAQGERLQTSPLQVFVDDDFSSSALESKRAARLTNPSLTLRQRVEGVSTEEEMLAQKPLKNFTGDHGKTSAHVKPAHKQTQRAEGRSGKACYGVEQLKSGTGETLSFEEVRARAYTDRVTVHRKLDDGSKQNRFLADTAASNATFASAPRSNTFLASSSTLNPPSVMEPTKRKSPFPVASKTIPAAKLMSLSNDAQEDMTINTRVAMEDINGMFCSPPRQATQPTAWELKEEDPVERKLHFSVFEDSVDSVALNDQSLRQDPNESLSKQCFEVFADEGAEASQTGKKTWSQQRKPLGSRDDLVRGVRVTNKDAIMRAETVGAAKDSSSKKR
ncbi:hypothetical protein BBJ28_00003104 [Nothophytophthora sp. Chile5]|nr:hypothetical protein BBJ28_00003104 [Nothophytophthora sp. Chile5]